MNPNQRLKKPEITPHRTTADAITGRHLPLCSTPLIRELFVFVLLCPHSYGAFATGRI
ncbi:hypothetical protein SAMN05216420_11349 [Nitrosospira sp. Nl5]|nr:hypothetical protein SAMN05216420_11349 [Nitrosospira sp. Nl5]